MTEDTTERQKADEKTAHTWRENITKEMSRNGEAWDDAVSVSWDKSADEFLVNQGESVTLDSNVFWRAKFTIWTKKRVYFPAVYEDHQWTESVSRDPDGVATGPVGGS